MSASVVPAVKSTVVMKPTVMKVVMVKVIVVTVTATATAHDSDIHATVGGVGRPVIAWAIPIVVPRGVRVIAIAVTRRCGDTAGEQKRGSSNCQSMFEHCSLPVES
jgi:hypothetical protein